MTPPIDATPSFALSDFIGGLVAAEGTFTRTVAHTRSDGLERLSFTFAVALGAADHDSVELLQRVLGVGRVRSYARRKAHFDDEVVIAVRAIDDLIGVVVPFMDEHLPASHKRTQYEVWRAELLAYDSRRAVMRTWSRRRRADPADPDP